MTRPVYDENDPIPYVDHMIRAAFADADFTVSSIERHNETTTVHAVHVLSGEHYEWANDGECSDDDAPALTFTDCDDAAPFAITVTLFPDA